MDNADPINLKPQRRPCSEKQLANLRKHGFQKGQSGNKTGVSRAQARSFAEATVYCRELANSPLANDTIVRLLRNKRNPKLQLTAWIAVWERAYGGVVQIATIESKLSIEDKRTSGDAALPAPHTIDPSDPQQLRRAITVAKGLADLLASTHPQPQLQVEPHDRDGRTLDEAIEVLPPAPEPCKVIAMQRGPERFNGAGARLEVISDAEQEKFRQKPFRG